MSNSIFLSTRYRRYYQNISPIFKKKKNQAYFMVILSLITMSFFGFFAVRPTLKTIATLQKQIEDRSLVDTQLEEKINSLILAQEAYQRIETYVPTIYNLLPDRPEVTSLLIRLQELSGVGSASISAIAFDPVVLYGKKAVTVQPTGTVPEKVDVLGTETVSQTTSVAFTLAYLGSYADLMRILEQLMKLDRIITLHSVELKISDTSAQIGTLVVTLTSQAYYYPLDI